MKTVFAKKEDLDKRKWYVIDARDKVLGRLATQAADILRGKRNPAFTPHVDTGDFVVVINAQRVKLTGKKLEKKTYYRHTGYIGGIKAITAEKLLQKKPEEVVRHAVKGMLPKNRLGSQLLRKLKVYAGEEHPHEAQKPIPFA
jgi:large subunit ribosomal protein L13